MNDQDEAVEVGDELSEHYVIPGEECDEPAVAAEYPCCEGVTGQHHHGPVVDLRRAR
jgi:hypothetical protein